MPVILVLLIYKCKSMKKLFIGIDFAKEKFDATVIEACGLKEFGCREHAAFANTAKGFRQFHKWVRSHAQGHTPAEWLFCGEDTGSCGISLSRWLYGKGFDVWIENAYVIRHSSGLVRLKAIRQIRR